MNIITFTTEDPECPENARAIAYIRMLMPGKSHKMAMDWLPVMFPGATPEEARASAQRHWDANAAKSTDKRRGPKAPKEPADIGEII